MCQQRGLDADTPGSVIDITAGREILPANVKPQNYHLTLEPDLETFTFEGTVVIEYALQPVGSDCRTEFLTSNSLEVVEDTTDISVNAVELNIRSAKLSHGGTTAQQQKGIK